MKGILVLNGMGSGLQYKAPERLKDPSTPEGGKVHRICSDMDSRFGKGSWMLVYGGDPLNEDAPDLAVMAHHIQGAYGCHVCAVQCDCVLGRLVTSPTCIARHTLTCVSALMLYDLRLT